MKKSLIVLLMLLISFSLCGCDSRDYADAEALFSSGDYSKALTIYESLGGYKQSTERVKECKYQLAKAAFSKNDWDLAIEYLTDLDYEDSENLLTDCNFLLDLQKAILNRMELNKNGTDYETLTNTELKYLRKYKNATFSSKELKNYAKDYIEGLQIQKDALSLKHSDYQVEWQRGFTYRCHVLNDLLDKYDFLSDNMDFVGRYSDYEEELALLKAMQSINESLKVELREAQVVNSDYETWVTYKNSTNYSYDLIVYLTLYDSDGVRFGETQGYFSNIQPNSQNKLTFYTPSHWSTAEYSWEINVL